MDYLENLSESELKQHLGELREKYTTADANLQNLKAISKRGERLLQLQSVVVSAILCVVLLALVCFESLKKKYAENQQTVSGKSVARALNQLAPRALVRRGFDCWVY